LTTEERGTNNRKKVTFRLNEETKERTERRGAREEVEDNIRKKIKLN